MAQGDSLEIIRRSGDEVPDRRMEMGGKWRILPKQVKCVGLEARVFLSAQ